MSLLCTPNQVASPPIWSQAVKEDYSNTLGALPEYVGTKETNKRRFSDQREIVFASLDNQEPSYDAYEKDFAIAHFYFESPTAFQFEKAVSIFISEYSSNAKL